MGFRVVVMVAAVLVCVWAPVSAQVRPDSGAFITMLGNDTMALERFVHTPTHLQVEALTRVPQTRLLYLTVDWDAAGRLTGYQLIDAPAPGSGGPARIRTIATSRGDSLHLEVVQGAGVPRRRVIALGADVPLISPIYALYDVLLARAQPARSTRLAMLGQQGAITYAVNWQPDSAQLTPPTGGTLHIGLDPRGRMVFLDGYETTFKVRVRAISWPDVEEMARHFAQQDARGRPLGTLSPRDTARANIGGALINIDYGQPAARGRIIFGEVVPWDRVWRTGANAATQLSTTRDLVIGGATIPAGRYSLWTIPSRRNWTLILNRQTDQWGTAYDSAQDLVRIPMQPGDVRDPVERFTIDIVARGEVGTIRMTWDRTRVLVPVSVK